MLFLAGHLDSGAGWRFVMDVAHQAGPAAPGKGMAEGNADSDQDQAVDADRQHVAITQLMDVRRRSQRPVPLRRPVGAGCVSGA